MKYNRRNASTQLQQKKSGAIVAEYRFHFDETPTDASDITESGSESEIENKKAVLYDSESFVNALQGRFTIKLAYLHRCAHEPVMRYLIVDHYNHSVYWTLEWPLDTSILDIVK